MRIVCFAVLFMLFAVGVSATCHDSDPCEKVELRLWREVRWEKPFNNRVDYRTNTTSHGENMPNFVTDTTEAAKQWKETYFDGDYIPFYPRHLGSTTLLPAEDEETDGTNVVGWKGLGQDADDPLAVTYIWRFMIWRTRIKEADIGLNYYKNLETHADCETDDYCLRAIMAHEFGHFSGLWHVTPEDAEDDECEAHYPRYTMYAKLSKDKHDFESLECEDKWAHRKNYEDDID